MKKMAARLLAAALACMLSPAALADDEAAARTIARVLTGLNHFPSDEDKAALRAVAEDDGVGRAFRAVARAVANIQHSVGDADRQALNRIVEADRAAEEAKALARIALGLNHRASDAAKAQLAAML